MTPLEFCQNWLSQGSVRWSSGIVKYLTLRTPIVFMVIALLDFYPFTK